MKDVKWLVFSVLSSMLAVVGAAGIYLELVHPKGVAGSVLYTLTYLAVGMLHHVVCAYLYGVGQHLPKRPIGRNAKCVVLVTTVSSAVILRHFLLWYKFVCLMALVGFTADLHALCQLLNVGSDISMCEVLLGSVMQILVYVTGGNTYASAAVLVVCGGVILFKYFSYSTPTTASDLEEHYVKLCTVV